MQYFIKVQIIFKCILQSEVTFYCSADVPPKNNISNHKTNNIPPQMKILNMVILILMQFLTFIRQNYIILHRIQVRQERKTTTLTNYKRCYSWHRVFNGMSQNILSQILDVIQSDVALYSLVH